MWDWLIKTRRKTTNNALILMYHRVAELRYDPWNLAVTPACFRDQIKNLKTNHTIVCLSDLQQAMSDGIKNPIAITFIVGDRLMHAGRPSFRMCSPVVSGQFALAGRCTHGARQSTVSDLLLI